MTRWKKALMIVAAVVAGTLPSCSTLLGTSVRDAAIGGVATFVEATTAELLNRWFNPDDVQQ